MLASSGLRPARAFAIRFQPAVIASCSAPAAPFSTSAPTRPTNKTPRTARPAVFTPRTTPSQITIRNESSASGAAAAQQAPSSTAATGSEKLLTWNDFLALRRTRRKINVVASGFTAVGVTYAGLQAFISGGYDSTLAASFGLDPLMVTGLSTIGMLGAGWLIGPFFGGAIFSMRYRTIGADIQRKEREFYNRIKRHRVDPTSSSMANPVPDYYGEKIGSVADYRRWLKDQRAFNLKRGAYQGGK